MPGFILTSGYLQIAQIPATHDTRFAGKSNLQYFPIDQGISQVCYRLFCLSFANGGISGARHVAAGIPVTRAGRTGLGDRCDFVHWRHRVDRFRGIGEYAGLIFVTQSARPQFTVKEICRSGPAEDQDLKRANRVGSVRLASFGSQE